MPSQTLYLQKWKVVHKLSIMESDETRELLRIADQAEAAPYVDYPPTPWWYYPAVGGWAAAMVGNFAWLHEQKAVFFGILATLIVAEVVFITWMSRRHGALPMPGQGTPPAEIRVEWNRYFVSLPIVAGLIALAWWIVGIAVAAAVTFVAVTGGLMIYERRYARAAAAVRARLA